MSDGPVHTGGCLCGALRYEARGEPQYMGHCYCGDCRKASGSGFMPFMSFKAEQVRFTGEPVTYRSPSFRPAIAIFNRDRPEWAPLPPGLTVFETMPG